jgi:16S rRNA (cytidine1402-2'-O)-methyltransferase
MHMLSIVATPIGNLEDITMRALRVMRECDYVLCEDTRVTGKLLAHYDIKKPLRRYDAHSGAHIHAQVLEDLSAGKNVVLVSDAGTPGVSDPGVLLIQRARVAEVPIEVIPGPSAVTAAVSLAGIAGNQFAFWGYAPQKKGRKTFFENLANSDIPVVFFESTHRIMKALEAISETNPTARVYMGRELTKLHEELLVGSAKELFDKLAVESVKQKGEFVLIIENQ